MVNGETRDKSLVLVFHKVKGNVVIRQNLVAKYIHLVAPVLSKTYCKVRTSSKAVGFRAQG